MEGPTPQNHDELEKRSAEVFSSERREDYWAMILALLVLAASYLFPDAVHDFFKNALFW